MKGCTLVTGGSGFIGVYLTKALAEKGVEIINYDMSPPSQELQNYLGSLKDKILFVKGNILDLPSLLSIIKERKVNRIMHMAALFDWQESNRIPYFTHQVNVGGTLNVLEAAKMCGLQRVVLASSIAAYPEKIYEPMDEKHPVLYPGMAHGSHYGASKVAGEVLGLAYWKNNGVSFVALRFSGVYGYGMRYPMFVKDMVENALRNQPTAFKTGGDLRRDYTYIKDCVLAIMGVLDADENDLIQRVYLIGSGEFYSASEVAEVAEELIPGATIEIEAELSETEKIDAAKRGRLDISSAQREFGYVPRFTLKEGINDYIQMYREYGLKAK